MPVFGRLSPLVSRRPISAGPSAHLTLFSPSSPTPTSTIIVTVLFLLHLLPIYAATPLASDSLVMPYHTNPQPAGLMYGTDERTVTIPNNDVDNDLITKNGMSAVLALLEMEMEATAAAEVLALAATGPTDGDGGKGLLAGAEGEGQEQPKVSACAESHGELDWPPEKEEEDAFTDFLQYNHYLMEQPDQLSKKDLQQQQQPHHREEQEGAWRQHRRRIGPEGDLGTLTTLISLMPGTGDESREKEDQRLASGWTTLPNNDDVPLPTVAPALPNLNTGSSPSASRRLTQILRPVINNNLLQQPQRVGAVGLSRFAGSRGSGGGSSSGGGLLGGVLASNGGIVGGGSGALGTAAGLGAAGSGGSGGGGTLGAGDGYSWRILGGQNANTKRGASGSEGTAVWALWQQQQQQKQQQRQQWQQTGTEGLGIAGAADTAPKAMSFRVMGGTNASEERYRFIASLRDAQGNHYCGGSLVAPDVVLTAAHCLDRQEAYYRYPVIHIGRYYTQQSDTQGFDTRQCVTSIVHPGWSYTHGRDDLAMCILDSPSSRPIIRVASGPLRLNEQSALVVTGFGATYEGGYNTDTLQEATVYPQSMTACNQSYNGLIGNKQLCVGRALGGVDACQGDSGGPLLLPKGTPAAAFPISFTFDSTTLSADAQAALLPPSFDSDLLLGVVSWGRGCGVRGQPGVYTSLASYRNWINTQLANTGRQALAPAPFPSAAQLQIRLSSSFTCKKNPSRSQVEQVLVVSAQKKLDRGATAQSVLTTFGCKFNESAAAANESPEQPQQPNIPSLSPSATPAPRPSRTNPCRCTTNGRSGTAITPLRGCAQHGIARGDTLYYCLVVGGASGCPSATPSRLYQGAAWVACGASRTSNTSSGGGEQSSDDSDQGGNEDDADTGSGGAKGDATSQPEEPGVTAFGGTAESGVGVPDVSFVNMGAGIFQKVLDAWLGGRRR